MASTVVHVVMLLVASLVLAGTLFLNAISNFPDVIPGLFNNNVGNVSDEFDLLVTPAGFTFAIWGFIYFQLLVMFLYWYTTACREYNGQGKLIAAPGIVPLGVLIFLSANLALNASWLVLFDRKLMEAAAGVLAGLTLLGYAVLGYSLTCVHRNADTLLKNGHELDVKLTIAFVHNALGTYVAWTTIATFLNVGIVLQYRASVLKPEATAAAVLCAVLFVTVVYLIMDHVVFEPQLRYVFTPYAVLIWALVGSILKNGSWDPAASAVAVLQTAMFVLAVLVFVVKIVAAVYRSVKYPIFGTEFVVMDKPALLQ